MQNTKLHLNDFLIDSNWCNNDTASQRGLLVSINKSLFIDYPYIRGILGYLLSHYKHSSHARREKKYLDRWRQLCVVKESSRRTSIASRAELPESSRYIIKSGGPKSCAKLHVVTRTRTSSLTSVSKKGMREERKGENERENIRRC